MADLVLTNGDDTLNYLASTSATINALNGNDTIRIEIPFGGPGITNLIYAGNGNDIVNIFGGPSEATIYGGDGDDKLFHDAPWLTSGGIIYGGAGNDEINGMGDVFGDAGDDIISGEANADGGDGSDIVYANHGGSGGAGDDIVSGGAGANGGAGSDELFSSYQFGAEGNDILTYGYAEGGEGHDVFLGSVSYDKIIAGDFEHGVDRFATDSPVIVVSAFSGRPNEVIAGGDETGAVDTDGDKLADIYLSVAGPLRGPLTQADFIFTAFVGDHTHERKVGTGMAELLLGHGGNDTLGGGAGDDWLFGGLADDVLYGDAGADLLVGNAGNDVLKGGTGSDELDGGDGNDTLRGDNGADRLEGGIGKDILTGGVGSDTFVFKAGDSGVGGNNRDYITDFVSSDDKIDITALGASIVFKISNTAIGSLVSIDTDQNGSYDMQIATSGHVAQSDLLIAVI
jgi:Ca2+-binding RTX toxin-like protein